MSELNLPAETLTKLYRQILTDNDYTQYFCYRLDVLNENDIESYDFFGRGNKHNNYTGKLAHKIGCCNRYKGRIKIHKALKRLWRMANKECPEILAIVLKDVVEDCG